MLQSLTISGTAPIVGVSLVDEGRQQEALNVIRSALRKLMYTPVRNATGRFSMTVDHAFPIKGKGTVLTGTVIDGIGRVGMTVHIPSCDEIRKIKEIQSWKQSVQSVNVGERAALLITNLEPDRCNRTVICEPGALTKIHQFLGTVKRIKQFHHQLRTRSKVHLSVGFEAVMAECQFLLPAADEPATTDEYEWSDEMTEATSVVLLKLDQPVHSRVGALFLATKLDAQESTECRIAFYGHVQRNVEHEGELPIFRRKQREGTIERVENANSVICTGLFKKETDFSHFNDMRVQFSTGERGRIEGAFGKQGKCRVAIPGGLQEDTLEQVKSGQLISVHLRMKKYLSSKKLVAY
ncbi:elongation factor Tu GTP binding domain-containing protein [Aphelenchoides avenae]|nr:elongation factor Tu GTP binding domain-containing protein [Aphelenchus avenae]